MPAEDEIDAVVRKVRQYLDDPAGPLLRLAGKQYDDGWLYLVVVPDRGGEPALRYARLMSQIERHLRSDGFDKVLIVPSVPERDGGVLDRLEPVA